MKAIDKHEEIYQQLRQNGYKGWGGDSYETRMKDFDKDLDKLFEIINLKDGNILELGSGAGDVSIMLAKRGYSVTGIEISPTAVKWAEEKAYKSDLTIDFQLGDVSGNWKLGNKKFDLVFDSTCLHCIFGNDRLKLYNNIKAYLKPAGYFYISTAVRENSEDEIPTISPIERCILPEVELKTELLASDFIKVADWCRHGTHRHYFGVYQLKDLKT